MLPHPQSIKVNGRTVTQYILLFAQPDSDLSSTPTPFVYQKSPKKFTDRMTGARIAAAPARANEDCPQWVHDMYTAETRDKKVAKKEGEPKNWRTWHPAIDPYYWCYFGHEHGSYPGKYKPMLGYTAWKTQDMTKSLGRQNETNGGFKVFALPMHEIRKYLIVVVHMHLASSQRFTTRHHTIIFTVLDENWEVELEFHMKGDFGFASTERLRQPKQVPLDAKQEEIRKELIGKRELALRRMNVLNATDFPDSADKTLFYRNNIPLLKKNQFKIMMGRYEKWATPLNTCSFNPSSRKRSARTGFVFDVRNPSTAKRSVHGPNDPMTKLAGTAENRELRFSKTIDVGIEHCSFFDEAKRAEFEQSGGVFYTDPYFSTVKEKSGQFHIRQFIKPGFKTIRFPGVAKMNTVGDWYGHFEIFRKSIHQKALNPEGAILASKN